MLSLSYGQNVSVSKDTLKYLLGTSNGNPDSIYIFNNGNAILSIDSIKNFNYTFNYCVDYCNQDSIVRSGYVGYYLDIFPSSNIFPIEIPANDSAKLIFQFITPLSKVSTLFDELRKDSLFIFNNSQNQPIVQINILNDMPLNIDDDKTVPPEFELQQNYPNPFNLVTKIVFVLPKASFISLEVYDALGRSIRKLLDNYTNVGKHEIIFDGTTFSSGVYYYQLKIGNNIITKKMLLIK